MKYKYKPQKKLLGSSTYKMEKSQKYKYLSEILHLAPANIGALIYALMLAPCVLTYV